MSKYDAEHSFVLVKDSEGNGYFCPMNATLDHSTGHLDEIDGCIEEEVVGRYAGNLKRKPS